MNKIIALFTIFAILIGCVVCRVEEDETSIKLHFYDGSSKWWIAVDPRNDYYDTVKVELREASDVQWTTMMHNEGWGYFNLPSTSGRGFALPLSFRLTGNNGEEVIAVVYRIASNTLVDTKVQYSIPGNPTAVPTTPATVAPTEPATQAPTEPATQAPTVPATQAPTVPATVAPTQPATQAPTVPATQAPTVPATVAPTQPATQAPTVPATVAPTQPATQAPTLAPTTKPTVAPTVAPPTAPTTRPTQTPTLAPTTKPTVAPTQPATQAPTLAPTPKPTQPATQAPTLAPTPKPTQPATQAPTPKPTQPATQAPTLAPTPKPTQPATQAPTQPSVDACALVSTKVEPMKILVPLYVYPGAAWDTLITAANTGVKIIAIINPNSGPRETGPDAAYTKYMKKFQDAGIEMVGYVHTSWGARAIATVNYEIGVYAAKYPGVNGIFFDEAGTEANVVSYYRTAYNTVLSKGFAHSILNPGTQPDKQYLDISTNIVIFENYASELQRAGYSSWVKCAPSTAAKSGYKYKFSSIIHTASQSQLTSLITRTHELGMGLVYVTDGPGGCCTYNYLNTYFAAQAAAVKAFNSQ